MSLQSKNRQRPVSAIVQRRNSVHNKDLEAPPSAFKPGQSTLGNKERQPTSSRNLKSTLETIKFEKFMGKLQDPFEHQSTRGIWRAFGSYIAKQLISGKAVLVPKFGLFTFSASDVCLSGTTNPQQRDRQLREPVFMVGKDFVSGIERAKNNFISDQDLKSGICAGDAIRPMALKGANGVIPQLKANYYEIGQLCSESKDTCRETCERVFKWFSDRVRKGEQVSGTELPLVGRFVVRSRVAAFNFLPSLVEQTRGMTTKQFTVGNIFGSLDATHNMNMHVKDQLAKTLGLRGGSQIVSNDAVGWLKVNMGIDINTMPIDNTKITSPIRAQRPLQRGNSEARLPHQLSFDNLSRLGPQTPNQSFRSRGNRSVTSSRITTAMASHMSQLPLAEISSLMALAVRIQSSRTEIVAKVKEATKFSLRDVLPSSKILTVLRNAGVDANIIQTKQLLRELGFPFNGPSTSLASLLSATKTFLHGVKHVALGTIDTQSNGGQSMIAGSVQSRPDLQKLINTIRDVFYTSQKSMYNLFRMAVGVSGQQIDLESFIRLISDVSGGALPIEDVETVFKGVVKSGKMTFELFEKTFKSEVPTSLDMETKVIRQVREWMFLNHLSAESAFDTLCKVVSKFIDKRLDRTMFHKAFSSLQIGLSAAQVDGLFTLLVSEAMGELDLNMWLARIYEDGDNPLQMIREIVQQHNLTQDDLMFQMKVKLWDEPLSQSRVITAIRNLDPSISDSQIRALFTCLKDGKGLVPVAVLIQNLTGKAFETVDFRNKIFKKLYEEIYPNKEAQLLSSFQEFDKENNGMIKNRDVLLALQRTITSVSQDDIERFVRFLETNRVDKLSYTEFMSKVTDTNKKAHSPFRTLVNRIGYFIQNNSITVGGLLQKIVGQENQGITIIKFAEFLKSKVDKKADLSQLKQLSEMLDVDKDGLITELDVSTCIKNLQNAAFWGNRNIKVALNFDKASEVVQQIHDAMGRKKLSFRALFDLFDTDKDNMVSLVEFQRGLMQVLSLSGPIVEQLFNLMDKGGIGLVNYDQFLEVIKAQKFTQVAVKDNFDWEQSIVQQLRQWITMKSLNAEEAFKCFDKDFDGFISLDDLKKGLINNLNVPVQQIIASKMERLYRLLDTFKTGQIQLSDFQRLARNNSDSFDWKKSAIQQAGLLMSKKYSSLAESFAMCSKQVGKVNFESLNSFITEQSLLSGFSLTSQLLQQLFGSLDPHKKGYLSYNDWKNAFSGFNYHDHLLLELKTLLIANFANYDSAYNFLLSFGTAASIDQAMFTYAVSQLSNERFKQDQLQQLWNTINVNGKIDKFAFRQHFGMLSYTGSQNVNSRSKSVTIKSASMQTSSWETNVIEKIRGLLKTSTRTMQEIFAEFNPDGEGQVTQNEFRNAIRKLNLGISSKEIDQLMNRVDANKDGLINFNEFSQKFGKTQHDSAMHQRANDKLAQIKELMVLHMNSPIDAFRYFDEDKEGQLSFGAFFRLMTKCYEVAHMKAPAYPVVKDLFDTIDIRKDGMLDLKEWQQTFGQVTEGGNQLSLKATPLAQWETSREFENIGFLMAKHRKLVTQCFKEQLSLKGGNLFTFKEGKSALDNWLYQNFRGQVSDAQLQCVFRVAQAQLNSQLEPMYDYVRLVNVYKARHSGPQK